MVAKKLSGSPFAVDLFAGGGGLTLGLKQAGFVVCAAVEFDQYASEIYAANHRGTVLFQSDIRAITGKQLLRTSPGNRIDLIAACPPCQGFSSLTSKYKREDDRNELIFEFVRIVSEVRPAAIMMENVPGLAVKGRALFGKALAAFESMGYSISFKTVNVADYGVPQTRRRLVLLGSLSGSINVPLATHGNETKKPWLTVRQALAASGERPVTLGQSRAMGGPENFQWHVVRDLSPVSIERLRATKAGGTRAQLPLHLRPSCHRENDKGFSNVYGRMSWDEPAPTITGGCTTLSKGRFGHPRQLRTISVREAALLQSFPHNYKFVGAHIDKVCGVIGNALPPAFAKKMATACLTHIRGDK